MVDWEDLGLALGVVTTLGSCFIFTICKLYRQEEQDDSLLNNPV